MKILFKLFLALHVGLYRLTGGKLGGSMRGFGVLLLTTTGRKSGRKFTLPLGWFKHAEGYIIVASNGGQDHHPAWYHNLKNNPQAQLQVGNKVMHATARILAGEERLQVWNEVKATAPVYLEYEKVTSREIPLVLLHPNE